MGYDRRAAAEALEKAAAALAERLPPGTADAEREKLLFKEAIICLSGS
jgi:hypothetical protein